MMDPFHLGLGEWELNPQRLDRFPYHSGHPIPGGRTPLPSVSTCQSSALASTRVWDFRDDRKFGCFNWIRTSDLSLIRGTLYLLSYEAIWWNVEGLNLRPQD